MCVHLQPHTQTHTNTHTPPSGTPFCGMVFSVIANQSLKVGGPLDTGEGERGKVGGDTRTDDSLVNKKWREKSKSTLAPKMCSDEFRYLWSANLYTSALWPWLRQTKWVAGTPLERIAQMRKSLFYLSLRVCVCGGGGGVLSSDRRTPVHVRG